MKAITKKGIKFNIKPKCWWNLDHWVWALDQKEAVKSQSLPAGKYYFPKGSIESEC